MDNTSDTPSRPAPPPDLPRYTPPQPTLAASSDTPPMAPPPDLPRYTPPQPTLGSASDTPPIAAPALADPAKLKIRTAPELTTELSPHGALAPFNTRVIAAVIDCVLAFGLQIATWVVLPGFFGASLPWLVGLAYLVTRDSLPFLGGQSVGKKAMHLKAVTLDDQSLAGNWEPGLIRNGVLAIPLFVLVELFILISREDKPEHGRRLGDEWAKTKVIVVKDEAAGNLTNP